VRMGLLGAIILGAAVALFVGLSYGFGGNGAALPTASPTTTGSTPAQTVPSTTVNGVRETPEITYGNDGYFAQQCSGASANLHYIVFYPSTPGPHPIVFGMSGSGFEGNANCDPKISKDQYQTFDSEMAQWARDGYVAVNIEYHGYANGLFGDVTYPGPGKWGTAADGTVQLDVKPAVKYFFAHDPGQYGADERLGVVAFGGSSGAHNAYMLSLTGVPGHHISAAAGWSGLPDVAFSGSVARRVFDHYMQTQPGSDAESFADPEHRISATSPPQYIAAGSNEFIAPANAERYFQTCTQLKVSLCYERILNTTSHAGEYEDYVFTDSPPEISNPRATKGQTVFEDTIAFADSVLHRK